MELPDGCIDLVVTDPPFFDNVHYSELADFFFAWQILRAENNDSKLKTTRRSNEVQDANADHFSNKLRAVFSECFRVLKDEGLMVFSYSPCELAGFDEIVTAELDHPVELPKKRRNELEQGLLF